MNYMAAGFLLSVLFIAVFIPSLMIATIKAICCVLCMVVVIAAAALGVRIVCRLLVFMLR